MEKKRQDLAKISLGKLLKDERVASHIRKSISDAKLEMIGNLLAPGKKVEQLRKGFDVPSLDPNAAVLLSSCNSGGQRCAFLIL